MVNRRQREIQFARACMVRHVPCSIRSISFTCLNVHCCQANENASKCVKKLRVLHCSIFSMPRIPSNLRERRLACLMLACRQNTSQGMLGILVERYEIFA